MAIEGATVWTVVAPPLEQATVLVRDGRSGGVGTGVGGAAVVVLAVGVMAVVVVAAPPHTATPYVRLAVARRCGTHHNRGVARTAH